MRASGRVDSSVQTAGFLVLVMAVFSVPAVAGPVHTWKLDELAEAPALAVGEIFSVQKGETIPAGSYHWRGSNWWMTADVLVLRSYVAPGQPALPERLKLRFLACCPMGTTNGPYLPDLEAGQTLVLPLRENPDPIANPWGLIGDEGLDLTVPVRAAMLDPAPASTPRNFLLREIANTLSRGTPEELTSIGRFLSLQVHNLSHDLMSRLKPAIGDDRQRWAEVATSILDTMGTPRPSVADLFAGKKDVAARTDQLSAGLAQEALRKLGTSPETENLLIRTLFQIAPVQAWGGASVLLEFADNPQTTRSIRQGLKSGLPGCTYIAWTLAYNGHRAVLPEALAQALQVADQPGSSELDLGGAGALLRDFGSDGQLRQLAALVQKYQAQNPKFYKLLWQSCTQSGSLREVPVLAVVLKDQRIANGSTRFCDQAVEELQRASGQQFGMGRITLAERDAAVSRALAWIASH